MVRDHRRHGLTQRVREVVEIGETPPHRRPERYLARVSNAGNLAARLGVAHPVLEQARKRLDSWRGTLSAIPPRPVIKTRRRRLLDAVSALVQPSRDCDGSPRAKQSRRRTHGWSCCSTTHQIQSKAAISASEVADLLGTTPQTVPRWRRNVVQPEQERLRLLLDLEWLASQLADFYDPDEARLALFARHALLARDRPFDQSEQANGRCICTDRSTSFRRGLSRIHDGIVARSEGRPRYLPTSTMSAFAGTFGSIRCPASLRKLSTHAARGGTRPA